LEPDEDDLLNVSHSSSNLSRSMHEESVINDDPPSLQSVQQESAVPEVMGATTAAVAKAPSDNESASTGASSASKYGSVIEILHDLKRFLDEEFKLANMNVSTLNSLPLCKSILKSVASPGSKPAMGTMIIIKWLKENKVQLHPKELTNLTARYKVYYETLKFRLAKTSTQESILQQLTESSLESAATAIMASHSHNLSATEEVFYNKETNDIESEGRPKTPNDNSPDVMKMAVPPLPEITDFGRPNGKFLVGRHPPARDKEKYNTLIERCFETQEDFVFGDCRSQFVDTLVLSWIECDKAFLELKEEVRESLTCPSDLLSKWANKVEKVWMEQNAEFPCVSVADVIGRTFFSLLRVLIPKQYVSCGAFSRFGSLLATGTLITENGNLYHVRGVVAKVVDERYGIVQTCLGIVFFEKNVFYFHKIQNRQSITPGSLVKLHAQRCNSEQGDFYVATKVWLPMDFGLEPPVGPEVPGGPTYWKELKKTIETCVKLEPARLIPNLDEPRNSRNYIACLDYFLKGKFHGQTPADVGDDIHEVLTVRRESAVLLNMLGEGVSEGETVRSLVALRKAGYGFFDLRKLYVATAALDMQSVFVERVEQHLLEAQLDADHYLGIINVTLVLMEFFANKDRVAEGQLQEIRNTFKANPGKRGKVMEVFARLAGLIGPAVSIEEQHPSRQDLGQYSSGEVATVSSSSAHSSRSPSRASGVSGESAVENPGEEVKDDCLLIAASQLPSGDAFATAQPYGGDGQQPSNAQLAKMVTELTAKVDDLSERLAKVEDWRGKVDDSLKHEIRNLIEQVRKMGSSKAKTAVNGQEPQQAAAKAPRFEHVRIRIVSRDGTPMGDVHEFPTDENGRLSLSAVRDVFVQTSHLKFKPEEGVIRLCPMDKTHFFPPQGGWGNRDYYVHVPESINPAALQGLPVPVRPGGPALVQGPPGNINNSCVLPLPTKLHCVLTNLNHMLAGAPAAVMAGIPGLRHLYGSIIPPMPPMPPFRN